MKQEPQSVSDLPAIVYDQYGNPIDTTKLQSSPASTTTKPNVVYMARPHEPVKPHISDAVQQRHDDSKQRFPMLNLSDGEYIISAVKRHPIGLIEIWAVVVVGVMLLLAGLSAIVSTDMASLGLSQQGTPWLITVLFAVAVLMILGGVMATMVYEANRFFLTNESVTQHIQTGLFMKKEQTISLGNIEDASFSQRGILQTFFNYGSLRLSTEGDETTYRFNFVANPGAQVATLNNAVEAFKNGRPIDTDES